MELVNKLKRSQVIPIVLANGTKDTVNLHSRLKLPPGASISPAKEQELKATVTIIGKPSASIDSASASTLETK